MINTINLCILPNAEFVKFCNNFTSFLKNNNPSSLSVLSQYETLTKKVTEFETCLKNETSTVVTEEMELLEVRRTRAINGLINVISGFTHHFEPTLANAAIVLQNNLRTYSFGIARESYPCETTMISNLICDWETKTELTQALTTLNLNPWISELKLVNQTYNERFVARTRESFVVSPETMRMRRIEVMTAYYDLCKVMDANSVVHPSPVFERTVSEVNILIEQYRTMFRGVTLPTTPKTTKMNSVNAN